MSTNTKRNTAGLFATLVDALLYWVPLYIGGDQMQAVYLYISIEIKRNERICAFVATLILERRMVNSKLALVVTDIGGLLYWSLIYRAIT